MQQPGENKLTKKRILVVCQHYWPENFRINDIVDYFTEQNIEIDVLCGRPNYPSGQLAKGYTLWNKRVEKRGNVTIYRSLEIPRGSNTNIRIFLNYISFPISSIFHIPRLLAHRYDAIFNYQLSPVMMAISGIIIGKLKRIPVTTYVLDLWPENLYSVLPVKSKFLQKILASHSHWYYKKSDRLIALSSRMFNKLHQVTGKDLQRLITIPQAAEKLYETPIGDKKLAARFKGKFTIVYAGNISPAQSFDTMIEAAKILRDKGLKDIHWLIVGDGMSKRSAEVNVDKQGLSEYFTFEGQKPINDIPRYTTVADCLVGCLTKSDLLEATVPAKVMSYIASGKPIVLAMDGEVQTLINTTIRCGFAGPAEDANKLADNIEQMYHTLPATRAMYGKNAQEYHFQYLERNIILNKLTAFILDPGTKQ